MDLCTFEININILLRKMGNFKENIDINKDDNKSKIKHNEYINKNKLNYIKKFYINKLKKYLSIIKNEKNSIDNNINLSFMESTNEIVLEIQNEIYNENIKLAPFLNDECKSYFTNLELDYKNEEINSIFGMDNIYDSKYEKIKVYSDFNFHDASNVLLYMLVMQFNNFILCKNNATNNTENNDFEDFNISESLNSTKL